MKYELHDDFVTRINLTYPSVFENIQKSIEIGLEHVRAADSIRISYDLARDGWVIWQPVWEDLNIKEWKEVYFADSWIFESTKWGEEK